MNLIDQVLHTDEGRKALAKAMTDPFRFNPVNSVRSIKELSKTDVWSNDAYAYDWENE